MNKFIIFSLTLISLLSIAVFANAAELYEPIIAPDSPFYFIKSWKESIQTFFTFGLENKAKQYLHLAEVRLAEYQKMIEKGKTEIAEKTLTKYQNQLNRALEKAEELKNKGKDIEELKNQIKQTAQKHLEVLQQNIEKVPEQAKKGIENAIENSERQVEKILKKEFVKDKIVIKQSGGAAMLSMECADKNYIANASDYIIEGTVEKVESKWNEEKTSIFTYTDLLIEKYVKGGPFAENKIQIITPGGTVGEIGQAVEDQPIFHKGRKARIYFEEKNGEFGIVCGNQGVEAQVY